MLVLNPSQVRFGGRVLEGVGVVSIDRAAAREIAEWSDLGPHVVLADVPEQKVTIGVVRDVGRDELDELMPGERGELSLMVAATAGDANRRRVRAECVVTKIRHEVDSGRRAVQRLTFVAVSEDGQADPVAVEAV